MTNKHLLIRSTLETTKKKKGGIPTHCDPVVLVVDAHLVFLPVGGGLRVASGGNALQDGRLPSGHHRISGVLSEVVSQHCRAEQRGEGGAHEEASTTTVGNIGEKKDSKTKPTKKVFAQIKLQLSCAPR